MKLYIQGYKLEKDEELPSNLEEKFNKLNNIYKSRCAFEEYNKEIIFYGFFDQEEKDLFIKEYKSFINELKLYLKDTNKEIDDQILKSIKNEYMFIDTMYECVKCVNKNGKIHIYDYLNEIPKKYKDCKIEYIFSICLSNQDIDFILNNGKLPSNLIYSSNIRYWCENRINLSVEQLDKLINITKDSPNLDIVKLILQESIVSNLYSIIFGRDSEISFLDNLNDAIISKLQNLLTYQKEEFLKEYNNIINEYYVFKNEHKYIGSLRKEIARDIENKKELSQEEIDLYKSLIEELANEGDKNALQVIAYGYNEGDRFYPCDYKKAVPYLEKLGETGEYFAYNCLGYIYYYGRVNNKISEYEKAYKYFSLAEQGNVYEATYKLGDLYRNGYGIKKDCKIAFGLYSRYFEDQLATFLKEKYANKLPDICLRLASCYFNGIGVDKDIDSALLHIKLAQLSSFERIKVWNFFGNISVDKSINSLYEDIIHEYKKYPLRTNKNCIEDSIFIGNSYLQADLTYKNDKLKIEITPRIYSNKLVIDSKNHNEFYLASKLIYTLTLQEDEINQNNDQVIIFDDLEIDKVNNYMDLGIKNIHFKDIKMKIVR